MSKTLFMTKGLPASGKSTWAKSMVSTIKELPPIKRVSKDDLRAMLDKSIWSHGNEDFVIGVRNDIVVKALKKNISIIIDDTNFAPKHEQVLRQIADTFGAGFIIKDFTHVPLETCLERDRNRANPVGQKVIIDMYNKYLRPKVEIPKFNYHLDDIVICDIDGTIAQMVDRGPYEEEKCGSDRVRSYVRDAMLGLARIMNAEIFFVSGRQEKSRELTDEWLHFWVLGGITDQRYKLFMRSTGDTRKDYIIKQEIYEREIKNKYNVVAIFDDRPQVIRLWQSLGFSDRIFNVGTGEEF